MPLPVIQTIIMSRNEHERLQIGTDSVNSALRGFRINNTTAKKAECVDVQKESTF